MERGQKRSEEGKGQELFEGVLERRENNEQDPVDNLHEQSDQNLLEDE